MANNKHTTFDQMQDLVKRQDARDDEQEAMLEEQESKNQQQDTDLAAHTGNTTVHITDAERTKWNKNTDDISSLSSEKAPQYTYSTTDLTAGTSSLTTGQMHLVYE